MKSKTFSCERTLFRKNLLRFAPFWGLYTLCLLLGLLVLAGGDFRENLTYNIASLLQMMSVINACCGLLTAMLLFGDLFDPRMCSGLHALPLRREKVFAVNITLGLVFSLIPTAVFTLISLPLLALSRNTEGAVTVGLMWFLGANLQYLFCFGLGVLCAMLTGNRLAMAILYGGLNGFSMGIYLLLDAFYTPLLPGVLTPTTLVRWLCPVLMDASWDYFRLERTLYHMPDGLLNTHTAFHVGEGWGYLALCALAGILLLGLALYLYKKRKLECAGDFLAFPGLRPLIPVLFALASGCLAELAAGEQNLFLEAVALGVGWFVGTMLTERTTRVFGKKQVLGLAVFLAVLGASLGLTKLDPMGIARWVPEPQKVEYAMISDIYGYYMDDDTPYHLTEPEDIADILEIHRLALEAGPLTEEEIYPSVEDGEEALPVPSVRVELHYGLTGGREAARMYYIPLDDPAAPLVKKITSRPVYALHSLENLLRNSLNRVTGLQLNGMELPEEYNTLEDFAALRDAILADCAEGNMSPYPQFHDYPTLERDGVAYSLQLYFFCDDYWDTGFVEVYAESANTLKWLEDRGMIDLVTGRSDSAFFS